MKIDSQVLGEDIISVVYRYIYIYIYIYTVVDIRYVRTYLSALFLGPYIALQLPASLSPLTEEKNKGDLEAEKERRGGKRQKKGRGRGNISLLEYNETWGGGAKRGGRRPCTLEKKGRGRGRGRRGEKSSLMPLSWWEEEEENETGPD